MAVTPNPKLIRTLKVIEFRVWGRKGLGFITIIFYDSRVLHNLECGFGLP